MRSKDQILLEEAYDLICEKKRKKKKKTVKNIPHNVWRGGYGYWGGVLGYGNNESGGGGGGDSGGGEM